MRPLARSTYRVFARIALPAFACLPTKNFGIFFFPLPFCIGKKDNRRLSAVVRPLPLRVCLIGIRQNSPLLCLFPCVRCAPARGCRCVPILNLCLRGCLPCTPKLMIVCANRSGGCIGLSSFESLPHRVLLVLCLIVALRTLKPVRKR